MFINRKGRIVVEDVTREVVNQLKHFKKKGIVYAAFNPEMKAVLYLRVNGKDIPIKKSVDFIYEEGSFKNAINFIKSLGFAISAITEKNVELFE